MPTVFDVARRAGVSSATVSRVLSGKDPVADATRQRVLEAVEAFGYQPNALAQSLRLGRSRLVALVIGDIEQGVYASLAQHLQSCLEEIRHSLLLFNMQHREDRLRAFLRRAKAMALSAVVIAAPHIFSPAMETALRDLARSGVTVLLYGQRARRYALPSILEDDVEMAGQAVDHFVRTGRTPIAFLGRTTDSALGRDRFAGYRAGLAENGLAFDPTLVWDTTDGYRYAAGQQAMLRAIDSGVAVRGVLASSDELALGAMAAAMDRRIAVPEKIAFIGFGANSWCEHVRPALTTVTAHPQDVGRLIRDVLLAIEAGGKPPRTVRLPGTILFRDSA